MKRIIAALILTTSTVALADEGKWVDIANTDNSTVTQGQVGSFKTIVVAGKKGVVGNFRMQQHGFETVTGKVFQKFVSFADCKRGSGMVLWMSPDVAQNLPMPFDGINEESQYASIMCGVANQPTPKAEETPDPLAPKGPKRVVKF